MIQTKTNEIMARLIPKQREGQTKENYYRELLEGSKQYKPSLINKLVEKFKIKHKIK